jgi:hypothetical protein
LTHIGITRALPSRTRLDHELPVYAPGESIVACPSRVRHGPDQAALGPMSLKAMLIPTACAAVFAVLLAVKWAHWNAEMTTSMVAQELAQAQHASLVPGLGDRAAGPGADQPARTR